MECPNEALMKKYLMHVMPVKAGIQFFSYIQNYFRFLVATSRKKRAAGKTTLLLLFFIFITACSQEPTIKNGHLVKIESHAVANNLFYSGTIQPLKTIVITTPADGVVIDMPKQYGETVNAGQLVYIISSAKFLSDYKQALMQYIKAKSEFNNTETQLKEAEFLHKNQLISDDDYKSKQANFYASQLGLLQAKDSLEILLKQLAVKDVNLYKLSIADIDKITQALHLQKDSENIRIVSPINGVLLSSGKNEEETKKILNGDAVKQGDVLAVIGDMSGISVKIKVNELTVNQLKEKQKVKITGIAFPDEILNGEIKRIDRQGDMSGGGGLPTFSVEVIVPTVTAAQLKKIHVGMSAQVEINFSEEPSINIPINAVKEKSGRVFVQVYDEHKKILQEQEVKTGKTTTDSVAILSGLKKGDQIVVPG